MENREVILSVKDLNVKFSLRGKVLHAIRGISLDLYKGESLAIPMVLSDEVFLTYCGLGMPKNKPSLGGLVEEGRKVMMSPSQRYQLIIPAVVVTFITVSFYLIGNAFADASDPRNHV